MVEVVAHVARIEGEDQEHHECSVQSRAAVGMDHIQSHHACASERQAFPHSDQSSTPAATEGAFWQNLVDPAKTAVLLGASTGLRVGELLGPQVVGYRFREPRNLVSPATWSSSGSSDARRKLRESRFRSMRNVAESLWSWRLRCAYNQPDDWVFASPARQRQTALLAEFALSGVSQAGVRGHRHHGTGGLAHAAAQLRNPDEGKRRGREDDPGDFSVMPTSR